MNNYFFIYLILIFKYFIFLPLSFSILISIRIYVWLNYVLTKDDLRNIFSLLHLLSILYVRLFHENNLSYVIKKNSSIDSEVDIDSEFILEHKNNLYIYYVNSFDHMMLLFAIFPMEYLYIYNTIELPLFFKTIIKSINESIYNLKNEIDIIYIYITFNQHNLENSFHAYSKKYVIHNIKVLD